LNLIKSQFSRQEKLNKILSSVYSLLDGTKKIYSIKNAAAGKAKLAAYFKVA
jgi:hypothetical protein